jgi:hypothetical protein
MYALFFLDVETLLQQERVNMIWQRLCKDTIDAKCGQDGPRDFQSNQELRDALKKYCKYEASMEEIACTYGYPKNKTSHGGMSPG